MQEFSLSGYLLFRFFAAKLCKFIAMVEVNLCLLGLFVYFRAFMSFAVFQSCYSEKITPLTETCCFVARCENNTDINVHYICNVKRTVQMDSICTVFELHLKTLSSSK